MRLPVGTPVVLISIDTLRADRLPVYGYDRVETPAIDALRQDGILFERAWCQVPLTLPSHASLLTGLLPPEHGVRDNLGYRLAAERLPYLPRLLKEAGYATGAAVSAFVLRGDVGLGEGFDFYDDRVELEVGDELGSQQRAGPETLAAALPWLEEVAGGPFFLFFHLYEPHDPYAPPEPWASRYASAYDGEVAFADEIVGRLVAELERLGVYDRALVVLLSDHGEALGEHGEETHGILLHREVVQVPLLVKLPGGERAGATVSRAVGLTDVVPTVLGLLGMEVPAGLPGENLLSPAAAEPATPDRFVYSETFYPRIHFGWSELTALSGSRYRLIHGPDPELYDLAEDPGETRSVLLDNRRLYGDLKQRLEAQSGAFRRPAEEDPETRRRLAALGYLGTTAQAAEGPLPDPKSRLPVLEDLKQAIQMVQAGRAAPAIPRLEAILEREPGMVEAWEQLAKARHLQGERETALAAYQRALELSGGAPHVALPAAALLLDMGRLEEARGHAEMALPAQPAAWDVLAQIDLKERNLEEAEAHLGKALAARGPRIEPLVTLAQLRLAQGRFEEAIAASRQAEEEFGARTNRAPLRGAFFVRGSAYARLGESEPAARAFEQEIELAPEQLAPYTHLALLHALEGRAAAAGATLRRMVEANPTPRAHAEAVRALRTLGDPRLAAALLDQARRRWPEDPELRALGG